MNSRQIELLMGQSTPLIDMIRQTSVTKQIHYRCQKSMGKWAQNSPTTAADATFIQKIIFVPKRKQKTNLQHQGRADYGWASPRVSKGECFVIDKS